MTGTTDRSQVRQGIGMLESRWTNVGGREIHACASLNRVPPHRPAVVLIHGLGMSSNYMVPAAKRLAPTYQVYAPDLPGFGKSAGPPVALNVAELADVLAAWMSAIKLETAVLVGNSFGCQIIADFAARYPARVSRAVLQGPTMDPCARRIPRQLWRDLIDLMHEPFSLYPIIALNCLRCGPRRLMHTFAYALLDPIEEKLQRMRCPTLVVRGSRDLIAPQRWAEEVTRLLSDARLVVIPGGTHAVHYAMPLEFVRTIRPFFKEAQQIDREVDA
jgi:2-hydroxy-6-oxonona-2,4-dienedioate hydrolase